MVSPSGDHCGLPSSAEPVVSRCAGDFPSEATIHMSDRTGLWLASVGWVTYRMWRPSVAISASLMSVMLLLSSGFTGRSSTGPDPPGGDCACAPWPPASSAPTTKPPPHQIREYTPAPPGGQPS